MLYRDRRHAGQVLAARLGHLAGRDDPIVLALPRGGVPVAYEVAATLHAPLDVFIVRKLGVPGHEELAMGAIASGGVRVVNDDVVEALDVSEEDLDRVTWTEARELARRERMFRDDRPPPRLADRAVILVDDGLATGSTMRAAATAVRELHPRRLVVAVPVAALATCHDLEAMVDELICATTPEPFWAVGNWYRNFEQITDEEVRELLARAAASAEPATPLPPP